MEPCVLARSTTLLRHECSIKHQTPSSSPLGGRFFSVPVNQVVMFITQSLREREPDYPCHSKRKRELCQRWLTCSQCWVGDQGRSLASENDNLSDFSPYGSLHVHFSFGWMTRAVSSLTLNYPYCRAIISLSLLVTSCLVSSTSDEVPLICI